MASQKRKLAAEIFDHLQSNQPCLVGMATALAALVQIQAEFEAIAVDKRTPENVRRLATQALKELLFLLSVLDNDLPGRSTPTPLRFLSDALEDVGEGLNSRLLVTGDLAEQLPRAQHSGGWHRRIRSMSAAIVELLLSGGVETKQLHAAARVAKALDKGGYTPQGQRKFGWPNRPDTVKRWHNSARCTRFKISERCEDEVSVILDIFTLSEDPKLGAKIALTWLEYTCKTNRIVDR